MKYYHQEIGSDTVKKIFQTTGTVLQVSNLGILEVQSAFGMKVRTRQITPEDAAVLRQRLLGDVASEIVRLIHLDSTGNRYGSSREKLLDVFVVADRLLAEVAVLEGLSTLNPEDVQ